LFISGTKEKFIFIWGQGGWKENGVLQLEGWRIDMKENFQSGGAVILELGSSHCSAVGKGLGGK
jgi:hypothetical protein